MADETATVARLKGLLARIRSRLRPGEECAVQCQSDDIREAMLCLRHLDPGVIPVAVRLGKGFRRVMGDTVGEWLAELASDQGPEYRQQLTKLFGPFPESTDEADESVSDRRALLEGRIVQLSELVDDVFAAVERVYPSAAANPQGGKTDATPPADKTQHGARGNGGGEPGRVKQKQRVDLETPLPAEPSQTGGAEDEPLPDGPEPPDGFNYGGKTYHGLARKPFLAVQFLWTRRNRTAESRDLAEPVWEDHACAPDQNALSGLRKELNCFFRKNRIPWLATVKARYLSLREGSPRKPKTKATPKTSKSQARRHSH